MERSVRANDRHKKSHYFLHFSNAGRRNIRQVSEKSAENQNGSNIAANLRIIASLLMTWNTRPAGNTGNNPMIRLITALLLACLAPVASAAPITWTLNNVTFFDGAEAIGVFDFDADTRLISNVNIQTSLGIFATPSMGSGTSKPFDGAVYDAAIVSMQSPSNIAAFGAGNLPDLTGSSTLFLDFGQALTGAGGVVSVVRGAEYECRVAPCNSFDPSASDFRPVSSGSVVVNVPTSSTLGMIAIGLLGVGHLRRRSARG